MTSTESRTARIDDYIAGIADEMGLPDNELLANWVLCLGTVTADDGTPQERVVSSRGDVEDACWLLCRVQRLLARIRARRSC